VKSDFVTAHGIKTHFRSFGTGKEVLVFLHGWGGTSESFQSLAPHIARQSRVKVIVPDLPGFGKSENPPASGWDTRDYEAWLEAFLKMLDIHKAHFYGHSFGCRVIVRLLLAHPEKALKVILTGAAGIKWPPSFREKVSLLLSKKCVQCKKLIPAKLQQLIISKIFGARDWGSAPEALKPTLKKVLEEADFREDLPRITHPVLLLWGARDSVTPIKSGRVFEEKLPHATLKIFSNGRHGIHRTHEDKIVKFVTKFLNEK